MSRIGKVTSLFLLLLILIALAVSIYYNETLQKQVNERDVLIDNLTRRDSILNKVMDLKYDSISKTISYSYRIKEGKILKYDELASELDKSINEYNQIAEKHNNIVRSNSQNVNNYNSLNESFNSLNKEYNELFVKYNLLVDNYGELIDFKNNLNNRLIQVIDSLTTYRAVVKLFQSNYSITYSVDIKNIQNAKIKMIRLNATKVDSALILLPYFRDRLKLDNEKKVWTIRTN